MALVSGTTGLRRQSLELIEVDDWGELQPGHFWLCWKHDKKREEHDAVLEQRRKVHLIGDDELERHMPDREAIVEVTLADGARHSEYIKTVRGSAGNPMTRRFARVQILEMYPFTSLPAGAI